MDEKVKEIRRIISENSGIVEALSPAEQKIVESIMEEEGGDYDGEA
ncbi:hypothetical protein ACK3SF_03970 [Candidatus Nanosalina sp. VS9-1]